MGFFLDLNVKVAGRRAASSRVTGTAHNEEMSLGDSRWDFNRDGFLSFLPSFAATIRAKLEELRNDEALQPKPDEGTSSKKSFFRKVKDAFT